MPESGTIEADRNCSPKVLIHWRRKNQFPSTDLKGGEKAVPVIRLGSYLGGTKKAMAVAIRMTRLRRDTPGRGIG